ncbi:hypothetical protein [Agarivorans albus]|uniref:Cadherin domain-containing protein n=1 Tax=Agarivorans albus MKT 106 TaxID=1331007 RepID=R9PU13_AGAAL|nr:hypothetical protein [Agarivorans albus]GAD03371.1 hypothetical protein AALB_3451 [Agarivorans albus MKT 106]
MALPRCTFLITTLIFLSACGGGGTSSEDNSPPEEPRTQISISRKDAPKVLFDTMEIIDNASRLGNDNTNSIFSTGGLLDLDLGSLISDSEEFCLDSGNFELINPTIDETSIKGQLKFNNCKTGSIIFNGSIYLTEKLLENGSENLKLELKNWKISFEGKDGEFNYNGDVNILVEDTEEHHIFNLSISDTFNNRELRYNNFNLFYNQNSIEEFNGSIALNEINFVDISSSKNFNQDRSFKVEGFESTIDAIVKARVVEFSLAIKDEEIGKITTSMSVLKSGPHQKNTAPTFDEDSESHQVNKQEILDIILDGRDENGDLLDYDYVLLDKPNDATVSLTQDGNNRVRFEANQSGDYQIKVTAKDYSLSSFKTVNIYIRQGKPSFSIENFPEEIPAGDLFEFNVTNNSPNNDGPLNYSIDYGPVGLTINETGMIEWELTTPLGLDATFNFGINANNRDHSTKVSHQASVKGKGITGVSNRPNWKLISASILADIDDDGKKEIITASEGSLIAFSLNEESKSLQIKKESLRIIPEGIIGLSYHDNNFIIQSPKGIYKTNFELSERTLLIEFPSSIKAFGTEEMTIADIEGNGSSMLVFYSGDGLYQTMDLTTGEVSTLEQISINHPSTVPVKVTRIDESPIYVVQDHRDIVIFDEQNSYTITLEAEQINDFRIVNNGGAQELNVLYKHWLSDNISLARINLNNGLTISDVELDGFWFSSPYLVKRNNLSNIDIVSRGITCEHDSSSYTCSTLVKDDHNYYYGNSLLHVIDIDEDGVEEVIFQDIDKHSILWADNQSWIFSSSNLGHIPKVAKLNSERIYSLSESQLFAEENGQLASITQITPEHSLDLVIEHETGLFLFQCQYSQPCLLTDSLSAELWREKNISRVSAASVERGHIATSDGTGRITVYNLAGNTIPVEQRNISSLIIDRIEFKSLGNETYITLFTDHKVGIWHFSDNEYKFVTQVDLHTQATVLKNSRIKEVFFSKSPHTNENTVSVIYNNGTESMRILGVSLSTNQVTNDLEITGQAKHSYISAYSYSLFAEQKKSDGNKNILFTYRPEIRESDDLCSFDLANGKVIWCVKEIKGSINHNSKFYSLENGTQLITDLAIYYLSH